MVKNMGLRVLAIINIIFSIANSIYVYASNTVNIEKLQIVINGDFPIKDSAQALYDTIKLFIALSFIAAAIGLITGIITIIQSNKTLCVVSTVIFTLFALAVSIMCIINQFFIGIIIIFIISLIMMILSLKAKKN